MSGVGVRVGVGTRFRYDGETVEVIEMAITATGNTWPYLLAKWDGSAGGWQLSVLDGFKRERRNVTAPKDKLRFVNLTTGIRSNSSDLTLADLS